ncbi:MAG: class I SAM-dependent methyltransferase [Planctomycetota bacterium]|nr:class I SAM-dependent methyltransferase [Planctomycetota bacterium]
MSIPPPSISLEQGPGGLELRITGDRPGQGVRAGFEVESTQGHPLAKLIRGCPGPVVDATAGLGGDTGVLAALGREVLAIERSEILFSLLEEARDRLADPGLQSRIQLMAGDAVEHLSRLPEPFQSPAAIILDPMYPPRRRRSALPPKSMQALRLLHANQPETDLGPLVRAAFSAGPKRVLLKRPPEAKPLLERMPTFSVETKLVRWDAWELG